MQCRGWRKSCGRAGKNCCSGARCWSTKVTCDKATNVCVEEPVTPDYGDAGEECCPDFVCNGDDLTCSTNPFNADTVCVACGDEGEECCGGMQCNGAELVCFADPLLADVAAMCTPCGTEGQPLCTRAHPLALSLCIKNKVLHF